MNIDVLENGTDDPVEFYSELQKAINGGAAWSFQGSYGRAMMDAIKEGRCMLGTERATDYYGNIIPARDDVQPGTKGSREFVVEHCGEDWTVLMETV
jgi:hypothetical protein